MSNACFHSHYFIICIYFLRACVPQLLEDPVETDLIPRVVNGWPAKLGDVPYQIAFKTRRSRYTNKFATFCGGVIIAPTKLLSAAHCFEEKATSPCRKMWGTSIPVSNKMLRRTMAVAGNLKNEAIYSKRDSDENGQWRQLSGAMYPRGYKFPKLDIAIAFTYFPFTYNAYVNVIPIASQHRDYVGKCLVSGFGRISKKERSHILLLAHLELLSRAKCNYLHRRNMQHFVCTGDAISDVEKGDSGGPLVCQGTGDPNEKDKGILVGIVSGNRERSGTFFTRVSSYYHYIQSKTNCKKTNRLLLLFVTLYHRLLF